ncbi:MAG: hypothetical protein ACON4T_05500 [Synechococcus sp.]
MSLDRDQKVSLVRIIIVSIFLAIIAAAVSVAYLIYDDLRTDIIERRNTVNVKIDTIGGPFAGNLRDDCALSNAYSAINLPDGSSLESFLPSNQNDSPVVRRVKNNGEVAWCVDAYTFEKNDERNLNSIDFVSVRLFQGDRYRIQGSLNWSSGPEEQVWILSANI